ncbi:hypothetical protein I5M32_02785 [Pedobacter sp. SD-b]|uniref:Sensor of ECF-type sigma factor n=1 Tax=Pedobacter segetis TaxID=2793069 RepID=A0ABS1BGA3_9SPHI|nr:hypothetical protein [Pedobacter segetis]MBK0381873.1 hypothetical protein [Pedobacter segetis]
MKYYFWIILLSFGLLSSSLTFAQNGNQKKARHIESIKIGYLTRRLDLSPEESQKFWPVYNQYQDDLSAINRQKKEARSQNIDDASKTVDDDFKFDGKILDLKKKYRYKFNEILSPEKVKELYAAERDFREELIKQLKNRRSEN